MAQFDVGAKVMLKNASTDPDVPGAFRHKGLMGTIEIAGDRPTINFGETFGSHALDEIYLCDWIAGPLGLIGKPGEERIQCVPKVIMKSPYTVVRGARCNEDDKHVVTFTMGHDGTEFDMTAEKIRKMIGEMSELCEVLDAADAAVEANKVAEPVI